MVFLMDLDVDTKALPEIYWGKEWIRPDGELSVVVVVHEPFDEPTYLFEAFPNSLLISDNTTRVVNERGLKNEIQARITAFGYSSSDKRFIITSHHAFIFDLVHSLDFRPDMFYLYNKDFGFRRLTDCTPIQLWEKQDYAKMYVAGDFDVD